MDNKGYLYQTDADGNTRCIDDRSFADNEIDLGSAKTARRYDGSMNRAERRAEEAERRIYARQLSRMAERAK